MEKMKFKLKQSSGVGIFHDSRADVRSLSKVINLIIDKMDEIIEEINNLKEKQNNAS